MAPELEYLAKSSGVREQSVVHCVRAFAAAASNPEVRPLALQLAAAVREQGGQRPWTRLFSLLESANRASTEPAVECHLDSAYVEADGTGNARIEIRLRPSLHEPPERLQWFCGQAGGGGTAAPAWVVDEPLYRERVFSVPISTASLTAEEDSLRVPWKLSGLTILGNVIDLRGVWTVQRQAPSGRPLGEDEILRHWPGADRAPVLRNQGFHGRGREIARIMAYLSAPGRQRSVMVYGQRRIGKTSLLREMVAELPAKSGSPCGAFVDVHGIPFLRPGVPIADAFFDGVVGQLDGVENKGIWQALGPRDTKGGSVRALAWGLSPVGSLLDAFERLAENLEQASRGVIARLALFVDEFQAFIQPRLQGQASEVSRFMWNLRSLVQRSQRISLVLAGSGLQSLFTRDYKEALYGSIDEVDLRPFTWTDDRDAVLNTLMPLEVRDQLCRTSEVEKVGAHACELCGGHPMYLALLGRLAARLASGRRWTAGFLNHVMDQGITRGEPATDRAFTRPSIAPPVFYGHFFEALDVLLPRQQAVAKYLLAHIAEQTTFDFPWLAKQHAIASVELPEAISPRERLDALTALESEQAVLIDKSQARIRIAVPVTGSALRQDAPDLRREALFALKQEMKGAPA
jgi:hypothetical protein